MEEKIILKILSCPACGAKLKAKNITDPITCVHCENTFIPGVETSAPANAEAAAGVGAVGGVVKVEGMRTPASGLAYTELFFEEYDWETFSYAQDMSVREIDALANSLKASSADDKNTWFVCFQAAFVPYVHKIEGCKQLLQTIIEDYKKDNLDAYGKFDAYKRISLMISIHRSGLVKNLEKIIANAEKYGANAEELDKLRTDLGSINNVGAVALYNDIESIPEIKAYMTWKDAKIVEELTAKGIRAEEEYAKAKTLISQKRYVEALNVLLSLQGYSDSKSLIEKIDKYFLISDVVEIEGKLYYFKEHGDEDKNLDLHPAVNGKIAEKPIIKNISNIITNYADMLYYLDSKNKVKMYNLATNVETKIFDKPLRGKLYVYDRKIYALAAKRSEYDDAGACDVVSLDIRTGTVKLVLENIEKILSLHGNKLVYTATREIKEGNSGGVYKTFTNIFNVDTSEVVGLGDKKVSIEGFTSDYVVFTRVAPNDKNKNLYVKALHNNEGERLIEKNIYAFCEVIADKLFYYVGNSRNKTLININCDGTQRKEWSRFISSVLLEQGGWVYFIRRIGYNTALCKARLDGTGYLVIASDIEEFVKIKNGYLYYINDASDLMKVRMDGTSEQKLCDDVESVLIVRDDKVVFISRDDKAEAANLEQTIYRTVRSIYAVDFAGNGKKKLVYDIAKAQAYDENTIYYVESKQKSDTYSQSVLQTDSLFRLDVDAVSEKKLLEMEIEKNEKQGTGCAIWAILACVFFMIAWAAMMAETVDVATMFAIFGAIMGVVGLARKFSA